LNTNSSLLVLNTTTENLNKFYEAISQPKSNQVQDSNKEYKPEVDPKHQKSLPNLAAIASDKCMK
jgi:hypothetical protein